MVVGINTLSICASNNIHVGVNTMQHCTSLRAILIMGIAFLSAIRLGAAITVGLDETTSLTVDENTTTNLADALIINEGQFNKMGAGALALATSNLLIQSGEIALRGGTLALDHRTVSANLRVAVPTQVLAQAAFWVDATKNVITVESNGITYAKNWLDARETTLTAPYAYVRADADTTFTNLYPEVQFSAGPTASMPTLWFGGYRSLRTMKWMTPSNTLANITKIYHTFVVHGVSNSYGFVLGSHSNDPDFHIQDYTGGATNQFIWHNTEWSTTAVRSGRTYLDGSRIDGTVTFPKRGWQLLETALHTLTAHASNFFNDRSITFAGVRVGGDYLCEAVIFTNKLSEAERLSVQYYLLQKWTTNQVAFYPRIRTAERTALAVTIATNVQQALMVDGAAQLAKTGAGTLLLRDNSALTRFSGNVALQQGTVVPYQPMRLALTEGGQRIAATTAGVSIERAGSPTALAKTGDQTLWLSTIPETISTLTIETGRVSLAAIETNTQCAATIYGSLPNPGFEQTQYTINRTLFTRGTDLHGWQANWTNVAAGADSGVFIFNRAAATDQRWPCDYDAPEGNQVLALKRDASAGTTLTVPASGIYELSFYTSGRSSGYSGHMFDVCLVEGATTNRVATLQTIGTSPYVLRRVRLPWLTAGNHTLLFESIVEGNDKLSTLDNLQVKLISTTPLADSVAFNGAFERLAFSTTRSSLETNRNNAVGWQLESTVNGTNFAAIASQGSTYFNPQIEGNNSLVLRRHGLARATFHLPVGTYELSADVCNWNSTAFNITDSQYQTATASMQMNEGTITLGSFVPVGSIYQRQTLPILITNTAVQTVTLTVEGQSNTGAMLIDNVRLVAASDAPIIKNGGFESNANWSYRFNTNGMPKMTAYIRPYAQDPQFYTYDFFDGARCLLLVQAGAAVQDITFPQSGSYRLNYHAANRVHLGDANSYGHNPVRAWLAREGITNVLGWSRVDHTNFVRNELYFEVKQAGTYTFGLQGMAVGTTFPGNDCNAMIDNVSIEKVEASTLHLPEIPQALTIEVASNAVLELNYIGTLQVDTVRYNGRAYIGLLNSTTCPAFISGQGQLDVKPKGSIILLR